MARAATTSDVFNAIAEPQRREILVLLRAGERPVTEVARELGVSAEGLRNWVKQDAIDRGELGTGHAYERGGDFPSPPQAPLGRLGADLEWDGTSWIVRRRRR